MKKNHAVVLFDSLIPVKQDSPVISSTNFWITDGTPPGLYSKDTVRPIGVSPPDNGTKFRLVEFAPLSPEVEAKLPPEMIMKGVSHAPEKGIPVKHPMMHRTRSLDYAVILFRRDRHDAGRHFGASKAGRCHCAASDQSRMGQSRHAALPHPVRADGFEGAVKVERGIHKSSDARSE